MDGGAARDADRQPIRPADYAQDPEAIGLPRHLPGGTLGGIEVSVYPFNSSLHFGYFSALAIIKSQIPNKHKYSQPGSIYNVSLLIGNIHNTYSTMHAISKLRLSLPPSGEISLYGSTFIKNLVLSILTPKSAM